MSRIAVDTSALVAILLGEPDAESYEQALFEARGDSVISSANLLESMIVVDDRDPDAGLHNLRVLLDTFGIAAESVTHDQVELALAARRRFGKGRHPAALNYGDLFAYALAKHLDAPLLFKGSDFAQTDVAAVL